MKLTSLFLALSATLVVDNALASTANNDAHRVHDHKPSIVTDVEVDIRDQDVSARDQNTQQVTLKNAAEKSLSFSSRMSLAAANACVSTADLAAVSGAARVNLMKSETEYQCYEDNVWSTQTANMQALFNENAMIDIANEATILATAYDGTTANNLRYFLTYLRAGRWTQEQAANTAIIGNYSSAVNSAIVNFLNALAANENYYSNDESHAFLAKEAMILMYTADAADRYRYLPQVVGLLNRYQKEWGANAQNWFTKSLIYIYRAKDDAAFINAVQADQSLINAMDQFLKNNISMIGHAQEAQFNDVASEFGRMLKYSGQTHAQAQSDIRDFLARTDMIGAASKAWFKVINQVTYYEPSNCSFYSTCNYKTELEAAILPITHSCSASLRIRAQELTNAQLNEVCDELAVRESYFHEKLNTNNTPVADDNNTTLELVIYNNTDQYKRFSYNIFGNSVDNGGQYLEGDPSVVGNTPRFFAHEAAWLLPEFKVWNLNHEYVHYLDGRFNTYGDFRDFNAHDSVWWGEGIAEYIAKKNFDDDAIVEARKNTYKLSELFRTNYDDHDSTRIYKWGYLAVRFMFEEQTGHVDNILAELRVGDFASYNSILNNIGTSLDTQFATWLQTVESTEGDTTTPNNSVLTNGQTVRIQSDGTQTPTYTFDIPSNTSNLVIQSSGGTGDVDLYVKAGSAVTLNNWDHRPYKGGNNETVNVAAPQQGTWYVMGNPYGNRVFDNVSLTASWTVDTGTGDTNACDTQSAITRGNIEDNQAVCLGSQTVYIAIQVATSQNSLTIMTNGGSGDTSIYQSTSGWPSSSNYQNSALTTGTSEETLTISNPSAGWHYLMITGQQTGTQLVADFE